MVSIRTTPSSSAKPIAIVFGSVWAVATVTAARLLSVLRLTFLLVIAKVHVTYIDYFLVI